jgi:hypothetical protein
MTYTIEPATFVTCSRCECAKPLGPDGSHVTCRLTGEWRTYPATHGCCSGQPRTHGYRLEHEHLEEGEDGQA